MCFFGFQKSFYGEWMRIRGEKEAWEIVAAVYLFCCRLPIARFIDGFNTVFHLVRTKRQFSFFGMGAPSPSPGMSKTTARKRETDLLWVTKDLFHRGRSSFPVLSGRRWGWHDQRSLIKSTTLPADQPATTTFSLFTFLSWPKSQGFFPFDPSVYGCIPSTTSRC